MTRATTLPVRQFVSSGDADQQVSDDGRFRKLFVRALEGRERADLNQDGYLTGSELGMFLANRVTNLTQSSQTPRYGKLRDEDFDQGDFVFFIQQPDGTGETRLSVDANVTGAGVYVDGAKVGVKRPWRTPPWTPGKRLIRVEMATGYQAYERRINIKEGPDAESCKWPWTRPPRKRGSLTVYTFAGRHPDTDTDIEHRRPGFQQGMALDAGRYHVEVSANGYQTHE